MMTKEEKEKYIDRARFIYQGGDNIEIDDNAPVSESEEGAYVQAWVWVEKEQI